VPFYLTFSAHLASGRSQAREWVRAEKRGSHPVIYVANGSHANYPERGITSVAEFEVGPLGGSWLARFRKGVQRQLVKMMAGQKIAAFVDFAQGDGDTIGPGGDREWDEPRVLDERNGQDEWGAITTFPGLWGQYVGDLTGRENGPAGPPYAQTRTFPVPKLEMNKPAWNDPLRWAGIADAQLRVLEARTGHRVGANRG
jgi:hypothetical protein